VMSDTTQTDNSAFGRRSDDAFAQVTREKVEQQGRELDGVKRSVDALSDKIDRLIMMCLTFFLGAAGSVLAGVLVVIVTRTRVG
jgi:hypothetical protein